MSGSTREVLALGLAVTVGVAAPAWAGSTERVSVATGGGQAHGGDTFDGLSISADGRFVAFGSIAPDLVPGDTNRRQDVFVRDRETMRTTRVSVGARGAQANGRSERPSLSADGRFVAFGSGASNLVPGDTNGVQDIFVRVR